MRDLFLVAKGLLTFKDFLEHSQTARPGNRAWKRIGSRSREGVRSSDTAKFNARYEDFLVRELIFVRKRFFPLGKEFDLNRFGRKTDLIRGIRG
jgi:hypothetical protein